jgi:hypothetical protein
VNGLGAPGAEAVHLYYRLWDAAALAYSWQGTLPQETFVSPHRDLDHILQWTHLHRQDFGAAVALDGPGRTLAVGSPLADYDRMGSDLVDSWWTYPDAGADRSRGR